MELSTPHWGTRFFFGGMALFFFYATTVQLNDVDGPVWIAVYLAPACLSLVLAFWRPTAILRVTPFVALAMTAVAVPWGITLAPAAAEAPDFAQSEVAREVGGLTIVGLYCAAVFVWMRWRAMRAPRHTHGNG